MHEYCWVTIGNVLIYLFYYSYSVLVIMCLIWQTIFIILDWWLLESGETFCLLCHKNEWLSWCVGHHFQTEWSNPQSSGNADFFSFIISRDLIMFAVISRNCTNACWNNPETSDTLQAAGYSVPLHSIHICVRKYKEDTKACK